MGFVNHKELILEERFLEISMKEIRNCNIHGETSFVFYEKRNRWRCLKCQVGATQKRRDLLKIKAVEYKNNICIKCGYDKCLAALEFHHLDTTQKDFGIGAKGYTRAWEKVKAELDKCILVCSNCHREIHYNLDNNSK